MGILMWLVLGLIVGVIAKFILPGKDPGGCITTIALGIVGALFGGFIGTQFGYGSVTGFDMRSLILAIGGALVLLVGYRLWSPRRRIS